MGGELAIEQKTFGQTRRAEIVEDRVHFTLSSRWDSQDYWVRFEDILPTPIEFTERRASISSDVYEGGLWGLSILFVFMISKDGEGIDPLGAYIVVALCAAAAGCIRLLRCFPRRQLVQITSVEPALILSADRPSRDAVSAFLDELQTRTQAYLREIYGTAAVYESKVGQIERLLHLKEQEVLSQEEFDSLKAELIAPTQTADPEATGLYI